MENEKKEQSLDPQNAIAADQIDLISMIWDFLRSALKFWYLIILFTAAGAALFYYRADKSYYPNYECRASFTVATNGNGTSGYQYSYFYDKSITSQMAKTFPYILQSDLLTDLVKQELGVDNINGSISASAIDNSNLFELTVRSNNPKDALDILNAVINNYGDVARYVLGETELNMIEQPILPTEPLNKNSAKRSGVKGAIVGFLLALALAFIHSQTRDTIRKEDEVESRLHVKCLGVVPQVIFKKRRHNIDETLSIHNRAVGESFIECNRSIALRIEKIMKEKKHKIILVTSTSPGEGVSVLAHNLAYSFADMDRKVLLMEFGRHTDDHFKKSMMPNPERGIEEVLMNNCSIEDALIKGENANISYLRYKEQHDTQIRNYTAMSLRRMMDTLRETYDYILIDAPSFTRMSDVAAVAELSDNVIYAVEQDKSRSYKVLEGIEEAGSYGAYFAGVILTNVKSGITGYGYGKYGKYGRYYGKYGYGKYGYGYGYGYGRRHYGSRYGEDPTDESNEEERV